MKTYPLVSVVIVTVNNIEWLVRSLANLHSQGYPRIEVFVVDNASSDSTVSVLKRRFKWVKLITLKSNLGFGRAANKALKLAKGKYVWIYNDDALCEHNTIKKAIDHLESDPTIAACQGTILYPDRKDVVESVGAFLTPTGILIKEHGFRFDPKVATETEIFNSNLPFIRMAALRKIGLFDEDYFLYFEEADLCWRFWLAGYRVVYLPQVRYFHARGVTTRKLPPTRIIESAFGNRINSLIKNAGFETLVWILPVHILICLGGMFAYTIKLKPQGAYAILKAIVRNIGGLTTTLRKRQAIQAMRVVTDKDLMRRIMKPMSIRYFITNTLDYLTSW